MEKNSTQEIRAWAFSDIITPYQIGIIDLKAGRAISYNDQSQSPSVAIHGQPMQIFSFLTAANTDPIPLNH